MNIPLLDSIIGEYPNHRPIPRMANQYEVCLSIQQNLSRLCNTRQGSVTNLADYGLPDFSHYHTEGIDDLMHIAQAIQHVIYRYEPRLCDISVTLKLSATDTPALTANGHLQFVLKATLMDTHPVTIPILLVPGDSISVAIPATDTHHAKRRTSPSASTFSTQRMHMVGCCESWPTSSR